MNADTLTKEWLETDGLGGFASGTVGGGNTRRYHGLLMRTLGSPSQRRLLVNGAEVFAVAGGERTGLSAQYYHPGVWAPDGFRLLVEFRRDPWPTWVYRLPDGSFIEQEFFLAQGRALAVLRWRRTAGTGPLKLEVRPFFSGRDPHALHRENPAFRLGVSHRRESVLVQAYPDIPAVALKANGTFRTEAHWYRNFHYIEEGLRGLDDREDLAAPGVLEFDLGGQEAALILASPATESAWAELESAGAAELAGRLAGEELVRRTSVADPLERAARQYLVRRGRGHTIIAGYPWFTDWGRDTFIALRGLCLATGQLEEAGSILEEWAETVSEGMLPNFFPEGAARPEYNSADASLWYAVAVHDYLRARQKHGRGNGLRETNRLLAAVESIVDGYRRGTRYGIGMDEDGLLRAGQPGVQLTWMDAKIGDWVVTPRSGKPVELQALWIHALEFMGGFSGDYLGLAGRARENFGRRFWNPRRGCLYDVVDVEGRSGEVDEAVRPNQIFAVGGLPRAVLAGEQAARVVAVVKEQLWTPLGLRSLEPGHVHYRPRYAGGVWERDSAYHQGTVWPWLAGPLIEAFLRVHDWSEAARRQARKEWLAPLLAHLEEAGLGHVSEVADGEAPHRPGGCPFQAWSLGEVLRARALLDQTSEEHF